MAEVVPEYSTLNVEMPKPAPSSGVGDGDRRVFSLPVDSEHKSTVFRPHSIAAPHMRAFHLAWTSFFCCFVSTFAIPPLVPVIRDDLDLTDNDISNAGIASVSGAVLARLAMGTACDLVGPRLASASLILLTAPAVFLTSVIDSAAGFVLVRFFTGFSLATFVSTQFWMSSMFSAPRAGVANGFAGGWGNLGGGATQLIMPVVYSVIRGGIGATSFTAWRVAFFVPAVLQTASAAAVVLLGQDAPDGDFRTLKVSGDRPKDSFGKLLRTAVGNYRAWVLALTYGYCFGVELTVDNVIAQYLHDTFDLSVGTAGVIAATFGMANVISRPGGGLLSDALGRRFGMRGRLWGLWAAQTAGGALCVVLGRVSSSLSTTVAVMVLFSFFVEAACGLTFGVVPFVSRRSLGVVTGMAGGGGNVGAVVTQLLFFHGSRYSKEDGISLMGVMIIAVSLVIFVVYFPQWGGMLCPPSSAAAAGGGEEEYYAGEWSADEKAKLYHLNSLKFAENSRGERYGRTFPPPGSPSPSPTASSAAAADSAAVDL